jgi:vacuolar protein-sorting-associated protein 4
LQEGKPIQYTNHVGNNGGNKGGNKDNNDDEKMKNALSEAIVTEKPNVKWTDISGL